VPGGSALTWLDLRFSVPGRSIPFVLKLHLDQSGRLTAWDIGGARSPSEKPRRLPPVLAENFPV